MVWNRKVSLIFFLVAVAATGYFLRGLVPTLLTEYQQARQFHPAWGYIYLGVVGLSAAAFLTLGVYVAWSLVGNSRRKARRRDAERRNPSAMSIAERQAEIAAHLEESRSLTADAGLSADARANPPLARGHRTKAGTTVAGNCRFRHGLQR